MSIEFYNIDIFYIYLYSSFKLCNMKKLYVPSWRKVLFFIMMNLCFIGSLLFFEYCFYCERLQLEIKPSIMYHIGYIGGYLVQVSMLSIIMCLVVLYTGFLENSKEYLKNISHTPQ